MLPLCRHYIILCIMVYTCNFRRLSKDSIVLTRVLRHERYETDYFIKWPSCNVFVRNVLFYFLLIKIIALVKFTASPGERYDRILEFSKRKDKTSIKHTHRFRLHSLTCRVLGRATHVFPLSFSIFVLYLCPPKITLLLSFLHRLFLAAE